MAIAQMDGDLPPVSVEHDQEALTAFDEFACGGEFGVVLRPLDAIDGGVRDDQGPGGENDGGLERRKGCKLVLGERFRGLAANRAGHRSRSPGSASMT